MPQTQTQPEPSMEEILASIRRIISEEEDGGAAADDSVLDLTQAADEGAGADGDDLLVFDSEPAAAPEPRPVARAEPAPRAAAPAPTAQRDPIVSPPAVQAASGALTRLAGALRVSDTQGQTIEGMVREMLKPMLKEWLDQNLPAIVEAKVEAELERIARLVR